MGKRRAIHAAVLSVAIGIAAGLFTAGSAQAGPAGYPEQCTSGYSDSRTGYATCWGGAGTFRAKVRCDVSWAPDYDRYSSWVWVTPNKQTTSAWCNSGDRAFNGGYQTRSILDS
ncbi:hypothetical protein [Micromonospora luteifusca]|uniref:hypothetical protein n=1 Tax=Micromonospora luteifusca TaxID=709860 RepID=UPI0033B0721A